MRKKHNLILKAVSLCCALLMLCGLLGACTSTKCAEHKFVNGVCIVCEYKCEHEEYNKDGKCKVCGARCVHEYENGVCVKCKTECDHYFVFGECEICGYECPHETYENSYCTVCYERCFHTTYVNGECIKCKYVCPHTYYVNGVCDNCHINCKHKFVNGVCTNCKMVCSHRYVNGVCEICKDVEYVEPPKTDGNYTYVAHISDVMPRIDINSATLMNDANRDVPAFDNYNPENNIDWQYHDSTVTVSGCEGYEFSDVIAQVKVRGNWTTTYPKKPFRIKFDKKQAMLGLNNGAKCKSWVLLADYKDCALERNSLAYYLGKQIMGSDGYYCSDIRQVELYLNGEYWGVYLLAEQQQVNENRINITEPEKNYLGTDIGYFIEYDGYYNLEVYGERFSTNHFNGYAIKSDVYEDVNYPEYPAAGCEGRYPQKKFIQSYINNLYTLCSDAVRGQYKTFNSNYTALVSYKPVTENPVLETVSKVIDIQSLIDMYIHCEIACDADLGWSSFFMDVDFGPAAKDNLLRFEAPWDFDSAFGFKVYDVADGTGIYAASRNPWLNLFMNEKWFNAKVKAKWKEMYEAGVQSSALQLIRTLQSTYSDAYNRNFNKWGFIVNNEATWDVINSVHNHTDAANQLYNWTRARFNYLNSVWL